MKKMTLAAVAASVALAACSTAPSQPAKKTAWGYTGSGAPEHWASLSPEYAACAGKNQTPINISKLALVDANLPPIKFSYKPGGNEIINNGHTVQVNFAPGSYIEVNNTRFDLKQYHFHTPSENQIDGKSYPIEGHLVHADKDGNLAVVGVMYEEGAANAALGAFESTVPTKLNEKQALKTPFDANSLLPANRDYYSFSGSLTTPPCSEGVRWMVLKNHVFASKAQIDTLNKAMHGPNNRPLQPVNARTVLH
ncbi:MAG: carbonic anhydrase family protein [Brachymonas sp.]|nr:carbonic anhydrase family protein [Brachymonas sp.]